MSKEEERPSHFWDDWSTFEVDYPSDTWIPDIKNGEIILYEKKALKPEALKKLEEKMEKILNV